MRKTKMEKGITLVALIITIVVLLILAVVAINSITNEGILGKSESAANKYNQAVKDEQDMLSGYEEYLNKITGKKVSEVQNNSISETGNTTVYDAYGNKIVVPAGFKIVVDSTTNNADTVTKGIVIEDCTGTATNGNQFVWIPVGKIYTDTARTEANAKTITLGRYSFDSNGVPSAYSGSNTEDTASSYNPDNNPYYNNAIARDIEAFIQSATKNGGYYIGRYEAGEGSYGAITTVSTGTVKICEQATASNLAQGMYGTNGNYASDLINSYAWDTAIVFLQEFDNREGQTTQYSKMSSLNYSGVDVNCNVYDMACGEQEWTTETNNVVSDFMRISIWGRIFRRG